MKNRKFRISRRELLRQGASIALGGLAGISLSGVSRGETAGKSRVVLVRDPQVLDGQGRVRTAPLREMLDKAVAALLDAPDPGSAWKRIAHFGEDRPISPSPRHIVLADTRYGLGRSRPEEIEIVRLGWKEGSLLPG